MVAMFLYIVPAKLPLNKENEMSAHAKLKLNRLKSNALASLPVAHISN